MQLAVDVEMNTVGGYEMSSWERGYREHGDAATTCRCPRTACGQLILNYARVELAAFDSAVTDWERRRGFERL